MGLGEGNLAHRRAQTARAVPGRDLDGIGLVQRSSRDLRRGASAAARKRTIRDTIVDREAKAARAAASAGGLARYRLAENADRPLPFRARDSYGDTDRLSRPARRNNVSCTPEATHLLRSTLNACLPSPTLPPESGE